MKNNPVKMIFILFLIFFSEIPAASCSDPDSVPHQKRPAPPQWKIDGLLAALVDSCEDTLLMPFRILIVTA